MRSILLALVLGVTIPVVLYSGYLMMPKDETQTLSGFGDPFLSVQLATSPSNGDCLTTDGTNNAWGSCASGSSKWTDAGAYIYPTGGGYASAPYFVATSTSVASTFVYASSTSLTVANLFGTYTVDVSSNTNLSADGTEIVLTGDALSLGNTLSFTYASTTSLTSSGNAWLTYASTTGFTASNGNITTLANTNATSSTSFFSALGTFTNAFINTLLTAASAVFTGLVDIGGGSLEIPNGTAPTVDAIGEIAVDSSYGQFKYFDGGTTHVFTGTTTRSFSIASTTSGTGGHFSVATTTFLLQNNPEPITLIGWYCQATTTGSVSVRFGDGTNWTNSSTCSTGGTTYASSNNTFTAFENFQVQIGSSASSPNRVTVTVFTSKTAQ